MTAPNDGATLLLRRRQFAREDRDEDDVVHTQHDFEDGECEQGDQAVGGEEGVHLLEPDGNTDTLAARLEASLSRRRGRHAGRRGSPWSRLAALTTSEAQR
jgi:hypothetical protein